jgi:hypothetical protein
MTESAAHARLVQALVVFVEQELGKLAELSVREDSLRASRCGRPPRIHGYVPDVFATNVPTTATLIGEAKTSADLETERSERQIRAFLDYLAQTPNGIFVLSVPLTAVATARRLVSRLNPPLAWVQTRAVVIDGVSSYS